MFAAAWEYVKPSVIPCGHLGSKITSEIGKGKIKEAITKPLSEVEDTFRRTYDRRIDEAREEARMSVLENPPPAQAKEAVHSQYRRRANESLQWAEKNLPRDEYEDHKARFKDYLNENVSQGNGNWSNGTFSHCYSHGSPDFSTEEKALRATTALSEATSLSHPRNPIGLICPDSFKEKCRETNIHNRRFCDEVHEAVFRDRYGLEDTPPSSPREDADEKKPLSGFKQQPSPWREWDTK